MMESILNKVGFFLTDAQRSTIALADGDTGTVDADHNFTYNAFGELQDDPESTSLGTKYLYTGQYFDAFNTELYNLRARQYNPTNGRFLSRDKWAYNYNNPFELNRYSYAANNPTTLADPSGFSTNMISNGIIVAKNVLAAAKTSPIIGGIVGSTIGALVGGLHAALTYSMTSNNLCGSRENSLSFGQTVLLGAATGAVFGAALGFTAGFSPARQVLAGAAVTFISSIGVLGGLFELAADGITTGEVNWCAVSDVVVNTMGVFFGKRMMQDGLQRMSNQIMEAMWFRGQNNGNVTSGTTVLPEVEPLTVLGRLRQIGTNLWESTAGLRYGLDRNPNSAFTTRVQHVLHHATDSPTRTSPHGVFNAGRSGTLAVVDEAYSLSQTLGNIRTRTAQGSRTVIDVNMGRTIGYVGGQPGAAQGNPPVSHVRLVLEGAYMNEVVTAFPVP